MRKSLKSLKPNKKKWQTKNLSPELNFNVKVRNGYVKHTKAPYPVEDIFLNLETKLPNLDVNQLKVRLDSLYFDWH